MSGAAADHFCPGCGARQRHVARYPWYFCPDCLDNAVDGEGRPLVFGNVSISGGLTWAYADAPGDRDDSATNVVCLITGRPVMVSEARFGGVVAQPACGDAASRRPDGDGMVMLTGGDVLKAARLRLKHGRR